MARWEPVATVGVAAGLPAARSGHTVKALQAVVWSCARVEPGEVRAVFDGAGGRVSEEKSKDLLDVMAQIDRICRGLLADVDRQAEIAEELTRFLPEEQR